MSAQWLFWTSYIALLAEFALIANLIRHRLFRKYQWFSAYILADALETIVEASLQSRHELYAYAYIAGQTLRIILGLLVVLEVYGLALERHPALLRFGKATTLYVLGAGASIAILAISLDRKLPASNQWVILRRFFTFERTMDLWMLAFLVIIVAFMSWFPVVLTRNGALYIAGFLVYFLARSAGLLIVNLMPNLRNVISGAMLLTEVICLLAWLFALTPRGEQIVTVVGHRWQPAEAKKFAGQLDAINAKLLRLSRR